MKIDRLLLFGITRFGQSDYLIVVLMAHRHVISRQEHICSEIARKYPWNTLDVTLKYTWFFTLHPIVLAIDGCKNIFAQKNHSLPGAPGASVHFMTLHFFLKAIHYDRVSLVKKIWNYSHKVKNQCFLKTWSMSVFINDIYTWIRINWSNLHHC